MGMYGMGMVEKFLRHLIGRQSNCECVEGPIAIGGSGFLGGTGILPVEPAGRTTVPQMYDIAATHSVAPQALGDDLGSEQGGRQRPMGVGASVACLEGPAARYPI